MKALNQISNLIILTLVHYAKDYPWASYIANSLSQFDLILPELMQSKAKEISIYLNPEPNLGTWVFTYANLVSPYRLSYETLFP